MWFKPLVIFISCFLAFNGSIAQGNAYKALVIGIDHYNNVKPTLYSAVNDAEALAGVLKEKYGFKEVSLLTNEAATKAAIIKSFTALTNHAIPSDRLLIFFSGYSIEQNNAGFWLPFGGDPSDLTSLLPTSWVKEALGNSKSKQTLMLTNAFFGYEYFSPSSLFFKNDNTTDYYERMNDFIARQVLTSGGIQPIVEEQRIHSIFGKSLLEILRNNQKERIETSEIYDQLLKSLVNSPNRPEIGHLQGTGHEGGQFVLKMQDIPNEGCERLNVRILQGGSIRQKAFVELEAATNQANCTYRWYCAGQVIGTTAKIKVTGGGVYLVEALDNFGCSDQAIIRVEIIKESEGATNNSGI